MARRRAPKLQAAYASRRRAALREATAKLSTKAYALLISRPEDVGYLCGFSGDGSCLLVGRGWACLLTDGRYAEQARRECGGIEVHVRKAAMPAAVAEVARCHKVRTVGIQADHMTVELRATVAAALGSRRVVSAACNLRRMRSVKDSREVAAIRKAVRVAEQAFEALLARGAKGWVGRSERELAAELNYRMGRAGASGPAFETIVAAGPHASLPHYRPGATKIVRGQPVLIDWGAKVARYCSDLTRVVFVGRIPPKLAEVYGVVLRAQQVAMRCLRAGLAGKTVDGAARKVIEEAGYGEAFVHSLGHGIGRETHELPVLARRTDTRLRKGAVVTVEPGIYLPGVGGVRIEDDVLVTAQGCRPLGSLPKALGAMRLR